MQTNIFVNSENRLRAGWRILIQFLGFILVIVAVQVTAAVGSRLSLILSFFALGLVYIGGILLLLGAFARWIDKRPYRDYGFHLTAGWWRDFIFGFLLSGGTLTAVFFIEKSAGWLTVQSYAQSDYKGPFLWIILATLLYMFAVGLGEEIAFRGLIFRNLAEGFGRGRASTAAVAAAFALSSIIFGLAHGGNPNASLTSTVNIMLIGLVLGLGYALTGELAMPIGMHFAWNLFEEFVYGFPNSGKAASNWLLGSVVNGPEAWTGGAFGPEAGLLVTLLIVVDAALILLWVRRRHSRVRLAAELSEYPRTSIW